MRLLICVRLRRVQLADQRDELRARLMRAACLLRQYVLSFHEVPPGMHPTSKVYEAIGIGDRVVRLVAVRHKHGATANAGPQIAAVLFAAPRRVAKQSHRWPAAVHLHPHIALGLWRSSWLLENLYRRFVGEHDVAIEQMITHQVDYRLHGFAHSHHARGQRIARDVASEALEQRGDAIQRQTIHIFGNHEPRQCGFCEQALRDDARACRRHLQALVAARACVLHAFMADHPHLLRDDVQLLAHFHADFDEHRAVVRAHALRFRQFIANDFTRQGRIERFAPGLLPRVAGYLRWRFVFLLRRQCGCRRRQRFRLVQEQVALIRTAGLALRAKQPPLIGFELLLEQIAFDLRHAQLATQCIALGDERGQFFGGNRGRLRGASHPVTIAGFVSP